MSIIDNKEIPIISLNEINTTNSYSISELNYIQTTIEEMNKINQVEVLRILKKYNNVTLNENNNGIYVNLSELEKKILDELINFINYVNNQESMLNAVEKQKEDYKNNFFTKDKY
jgi:hypothetical protein